MKIITDDGYTVEFSFDGPTDLNLPAEVQMRGILSALRIILRCNEGESLLRRASTVMRRADRLAAEHTEFGPI